MQTPKVQAEVAKEIADAGIAVFLLPQTNLFLQGRDHPSATPRGLTALHALQDAGCWSQPAPTTCRTSTTWWVEAIPWRPRALLVMVGHQSPGTAFGMVSNDAREGMGLDGVDIAVGSSADLLVIDAASTREAMADAPMSRRVYRQGVLVASADQQTRVHRRD